VDNDQRRALRLVLGDVGDFSRFAWPDVALRGYQMGPARAIMRAVLARKKRGPRSRTSPASSPRSSAGRAARMRCSPSSWRTCWCCSRGGAGRW
jgi:hypothetical protein